MTPQELTNLIEQVTGQCFTPEKVKEILDPMVAELLTSENMKREMVLTIEELQARQAVKATKMTFSQWLGDSVRIAKGQPPIHSKDVVEDYVPMAMANLGALNLKGLDEAARKSLYTSSNAAGGYLVPTEESRTLLDLTSSWEVVPTLCQQVPMRTNVITFPTLSSGLTAYWIPEATSSSASGQSEGVKQETNPAFAQMSITTHVLAIYVFVSNQLLDDSDPSIDNVLFGLFAKTLGAYFDLAILEGAATALDPVNGLDNLITTNSVAAAAQFNYDDIIDLIFSVYAVGKAPGTQPLSIIGHPLAEQQLMKVKNEHDDYIYRGPTEMARIPAVWGQPFHRNRNVSITLGAGNDQTKLYCGDFSNYAYVGNSQNIVIKANPWGTGFPINQTAFLAEFRRGFSVSDETQFSELTGIVVS